MTLGDLGDLGDPLGLVWTCRRREGDELIEDDVEEAEQIEGDVLLCVELLSKLEVSSLVKCSLS